MRRAAEQEPQRPVEESYRHHSLRKRGVDLGKWDYVVALAGNPNTGKSTVFNALTGLRQHTGNWPGKTVARAEGAFEYEGKQFKMVDLPGTYSLLASSVDEEVARDFLLFGRPDVTVVVVDATRLQRNLNLVLQVLEITDRAVLCLNLMDEAKRHGLEIDVKQLSKELGIPVVPTSARYGKGLDPLLEAIKRVAEGSMPLKPRRLEEEPEPLKGAIGTLEKELLQRYPELPNARWVALRLLDNDERIIEAIRSGELEELARRLQEPPLDLEKELQHINEELES